MDKKQLRKLYKHKRSDLTVLEIQKFNNSIYEQIYQYNFSDVTYVHVFLPIEKQREINTYPIIDFLRTLQKQIIISKSDFTTHTLTHFLYQENTVLEVNKWGIPEPKNAIEFPVDQIDLVFVPMLISDFKGYRVGYGKGFYDRFLTSCKSSVKTIGLNFFKPISKNINIDKFDVPLDLVIYPK